MKTKKRNMKALDKVVVALVGSGLLWTVLPAIAEAAKGIHLNHNETLVRDTQR
jgi:hypothetical protein